jgi:hypothetical protein
MPIDYLSGPAATHSAPAGMTLVVRANDERHAVSWSGGSAGYRAT